MTKMEICLLLSVALLLTACGGGGDDASTPPVTQPPVTPPPVTQPPVTFKVVDYPTEVAMTSLAVTESVLQVGFLANEILSAANVDDNGIEKSCSNGGLATIELLDKDGSNGLSQGDSISVSYRDCYIQALDSTVNGEGVLVVTEYQADTKSKGTIDISNLQVASDDQISLKGKLQFAYDTTAMQKQLTMQTTNAVKLVVNDASVLDFSTLTLTRTESFNDATYSINGSSQVFVTELDSGFNFAFTKPLKGHFNEFPHDGAITVSTSADDKVQLTSNFVTNSRLFNVTTPKEAYMVYWSDAIEGSLWSLEGNGIGYVKEFRSNNFEFVGVINSQDFQLFPVSGGTIQLLMSRPIKEQVYEASFNEDQWPYQSIPATVSVNGAILSVTPATDLKPDTKYRFSNTLLESVQGAVSYAAWQGSIKTNDALILNLSASSYLFKANDTPTLDASQTVMNRGSALSFKWVDVNNFGVIFSAPTSAKTSFTVPESVTSDLLIKLEVSNGQGYQISRNITIGYFDSTDTFMHFVSPQGDYIGAGQTLLFDANTALFTPTNYDGNLNYLNIYVAGDTWWSLDIAAPVGENLQVKRYENATRYPFQAPLVAGLTFYGDHRGCNESIGTFDILELKYNADNSVEALAVNFSQSCEKTMPALNGIIRYHSSVGINH